jgi:cyclohexa-1,5-dienecarbonyl-CoA hydratase
MEFKNIILKQENNVSTILINRPPYNVLNIEAIKEMNKALEMIEKDSTSKVVVVRGSGGKCFISGVDVGDHSEEKGEEMEQVFTALMHGLASVGRPTVAAVEGICSGGGFEVAMYCDMIVAEEGSKFSQPETKLGVFPGPAIALLNRKIGRNKAFEVIVTGDPIIAAEAEKLGLVNRVAPKGEMDRVLEEFCRRITDKSLATLRLTRYAIYCAYDTDLWKALGWVNDIYTGKVMYTQDFKEGLSAFFEKRKPVWKDR